MIEIISFLLVDINVLLFNLMMNNMDLNSFISRLGLWGFLFAWLSAKGLKRISIFLALHRFISVVRMVLPTLKFTYLKIHPTNNEKV